MMIHDLDTFYRTRWAPGVEAGFPIWAAYATPHQPGDPLPDHELVVAEGECCEHSRCRRGDQLASPGRDRHRIAPSYHLPLRRMICCGSELFRPIVMGQGLMDPEERQMVAQRIAEILIRGVLRENDDQVP